MLQRILKKDMKRRKSVNIILFLFITIASIFLSSSINNILVVMSSIDYYMDYANIPDVNLISDGTGEKEEISTWVENKAPGVKDWDYNQFVSVGEKNISAVKDGKKTEFHMDGISMYLNTMDTEYCKVFDMNGEDLMLRSGEAALTRMMMEKNQLSEGDRIVIQLGEFEKEFTIKTAMKDAAFGNDMVGMSRITLNQEVFQQLMKDHPENFLGLYYIDTDQEDALLKDISEQGFCTIMTSVSRDTYDMVYSFDMILAGLLILIGICLILIALLVLRFTLVFTLEEDYREIGIMKAIGLKNISIKKLYLTKYLVLVSAGSILGFFISIPVSQKMVDSISENMIMAESRAHLGVNILCTAAIIVLVMLFCYHCTRKLNKISAIEAIRGGSTGESYNRKSRLLLHQRKKMPVPVYLGLNDMLSHVRQYLVLIITFCISFILITIPLNTLNTMKSGEMAVKFVINPESTAYLVSKIENAEMRTYKNNRDLEQGMEQVAKDLKEKGYHAELTAILYYFCSFGEEGADNTTRLLTVQIDGPDNDYLAYLEGEAPVLSNEIALSKQVLEENDWNIGDTVTAEIGGEKRDFLITGTYADYMQLGKSARLNPEIDLQDEILFDYGCIMIDMQTDKTQAEMVDILNMEFPEYEWSTAQEYVDRNVGGIQESLQQLLWPMTGMLCAVIMLITLLMERLFIVREKGEIAMMKSIGYKDRVIRLWQILRMIWVALISMAAAVPLSLVSNRWLLKPIFAIMGADVNIQIVPLQVYGIYPGILLLGIIAATILATGKIKKINIRELNNLE